MPKLISVYNRPVNSHLSICTCNDEHMIFMAAERELGDPEEYSELYIYPYTHTSPFFTRLKNAWRHLLGHKLSDNGITMGWNELNRLKNFLIDVDDYWSELEILNKKNVRSL